MRNENKKEKKRKGKQNERTKKQTTTKKKNEKHSERARCCRRARRGWVARAQETRESREERDGRATQRATRRTVQIQKEMAEATNARTIRQPKCLISVAPSGFECNRLILRALDSHDAPTSARVYAVFEDEQCASTARHTSKQTPTTMWPPLADRMRWIVRPLRVRRRRSKR